MTAADAVSLALVALFTFMAVVTGVRTGYEVRDVDEEVYRRTLMEMRSGDGYYEATKEALVEKEGAPPSQIRSVRPPTMFLLLRWFPPGSWRWLVGVAYLGTLLGVWRLSRVYEGWGAWLAIMAAGLWLVSYSYHLFLHSEIWGAPLLLAGLVAYRSGRDAQAAVFIASATLMRELFGLALLVGAVLRRRRPWAIALLVIAALGVLHAVLASQITETGGREAAFGNERRTLSMVFALISPGAGAVSATVGVGGLVVGLVGLARARGVDATARLLLPYVVIMVALGMWSTRVYWTAVWAPALMAFLPAAAVPPSTAAPERPDDR